MIEQLCTLYPSFLLHGNDKQELDEDYKWFLTNTDEIIGIHQRELTAKDEALLSVFLQPYNIEFPVPSEEEVRWKNVIRSSASRKDLEYFSALPYRLVHFTIKENQINPLLFRDGIHEVFDKKVAVLWENVNQGFIIEQQELDEESISYEQIIDILMSDLYINIKFLVGPFRVGLKDIPTHYNSLKFLAETSYYYTKKAVMPFFEAVPYVLINQTSPIILRNIEKEILQEYLEDGETLKMITTFVQTNLNISEASKVLHLHRNTLQYRLDRFFENTGLDIRKFSDAMTVYLVILGKDNSL